MVMLGWLAQSATAGGFIDGEVLQHGSGIELGALAQTGATEYAALDAGLQPDVHGLVLRDRNGITARWVFGLVVALGSAVAQSGPKSVTSTSRDEGNYRITTTTTTYYSDAEKAEMTAQANDSIDGLFDAPYSDFELHVFARDRFGAGNASGYKANLLIGTGKSIAFETGIGFGSVDSIVDAGGTPTRVSYRYFGMPVRLSTVVGPLRMALAFEWNWLSHGVSAEDQQVHLGADGMMEVRTANHPFKFELSTLLLKRIAVSGGITAQRLKPDLGYTVSAGLYF